MADLPPEAAGRLHRPAFSSGLSVNDFAACLHMGMRPVGLVQGYCVMRWSNYGMTPTTFRGPTYVGRPGYRTYGGYGPGGRGLGGRGLGGGYPGTVGGGFGGPFSGSMYSYGPRANALSTYQCPHYYTSGDHRAWGENYEQSWLSRTWQEGFDTAYQRMLEEATEAGGHGIVGVVDTSRTLIDSSIREFHIYGTAVVVEGASRPPRIWTSYLAGSRLAKLLEAGFMPTSIAAVMTSVRSWPVCVTEALMRGGYLYGSYQTQGSTEITQIADAQMQARRLARDHIKSRLGRDTLHGADLQVGVHEMGEGGLEVDCILRGTCVHRYRAAEPLPPPQLTVRLND